MGIRCTFQVGIRSYLLLVYTVPNSKDSGSYDNLFSVLDSFGGIRGPSAKRVPKES